MPYIEPPNDDPNLISYWHPTRRRIEGKLKMVRDLWEGIEAFYDFDSGQITDYDRAHRYLPQEDGEPKDAYLARIRRSLAFERRFRNAIERDYAPLLSVYNLKGLPASLEESRSNVDLKGNSDYVFLYNNDTLALRDGAVFTLVEHPPADPTVRTNQDRMQVKRRPYFVQVERSNIINWGHTSTTSGQCKLSEVVIREYRWERSGRYGLELFGYFRRLFLFQIEDDRGITYDRVGYQVYRVSAEQNASDKKVQWIEEVVDSGVYFVAIDGIPQYLTSIPLVPYSPHSSDPFEADFPFLDLAFLNVQLVQKESDKNNKIHIVCNPTLVAMESSPMGQGNADRTKTITIGPHVVLWNIDAKWIEPEGQSINIAREDIKDLESKIDRTTLSFLYGNQTPTATQVRFDAIQSQASLQGMAIQKQSYFEELAKIWAFWEGEQSTATLEVNAGILAIAREGSAADILKAMAEGALSRPLGLLLLRDRGFFPTTFTQEDLDLELARTGDSVNAIVSPPNQTLDTPIGV